MRHVNCVIFDFDGTLVRTEDVYFEAFAHSIREHTGRCVEVSEFGVLGARSPQEVLRRYAGSDIEEAALIASFESRYYARHQEHAVPFAGVPEMLGALALAGLAVAVVSLKPRRAGERELEASGLDGYVRTAIWGDDVERPKPFADGALEAILRCDSQPSRTLVIGDSEADIQMGRRAGAVTGAALWGTGSRLTLFGAEPDLHFRRPGEVTERLVITGSIYNDSDSSPV